MIICEDCRYFGGAGYDADGTCRRRSPIIHHASAGSARHFPKVNKDDWCGEAKRLLTKGAGRGKKDC